MQVILARMKARAVEATHEGNLREHAVSSTHARNVTARAAVCCDIV